jgi:hypothetical protein
LVQCKIEFIQNAVKYCDQSKKENKTSRYYRQNITLVKFSFECA